MRILAAQNRAHLGRLALIVKRFQIMGHSHQVGFRRQLHRWMPPVTGGKDAETPCLYKRFQLGLNSPEFCFAVAGPVGNALRQLGCFLRISLQRRNDINPIQRRQMIKMDYMILHRVLRHDHIADVLGVERHLYLEGMFHRADRRDGMHRGADTAETLGVDPGILGGTPLQNCLNASPHLG